MSDLIIYAGLSVFAIVALAYGFNALNQSVARRRNQRLKEHLNWNGSHRVPRIAAAARRA